MNVARLSVLRDFLQNFDTSDKSRRFDMHVFHERGLCNTAACALGWACMIPEFREQGLTLELEQNSVLSLHCTLSFRPVFIARADEGGEIVTNDYFLAGVAFFNIDLDDCAWLFDASKYRSCDPTPLDVAERIDRFILQGHR